MSEEIKQSEITFLTPESVSVLYEGLSTNTNVYVFHHEHHTDGENGKRNTKVTKNIDKLKDQGLIGYIDAKRYLLSRSIKSADLVHPKINEPLSETKKVVQKLLKIL